MSQELEQLWQEVKRLAAEVESIKRSMMPVTYYGSEIPLYTKTTIIYANTVGIAYIHGVDPMGNISGQPISSRPMTEAEHLMFKGLQK